MKKSAKSGQPGDVPMPQERIGNRLAVVTGAASGIGREVMFELAKRSIDVAPAISRRQRCLLVLAECSAGLRTAFS